MSRFNLTSLSIVPRTQAVNLPTSLNRKPPPSELKRFTVSPRNPSGGGNNVTITDTYVQPDGFSYYFQPDGFSFYLQP